LQEGLLSMAINITTVFVDTRLWKTKFPLVCVIDQSQPLVWPSDLLYVMLAGCDWWISIRSVDDVYDWRKFWKRFRGCSVFESRVSTKDGGKTKQANETCAKEDQLRRTWFVREDVSRPWIIVSKDSYEHKLFFAVEYFLVSSQIGGVYCASYSVWSIWSPFIEYSFCYVFIRRGISNADIHFHTTCNVPLKREIPIITATIVLLCSPVRNCVTLSSIERLINWMKTDCVIFSSARESMAGTMKVCGRGQHVSSSL